MINSATAQPASKIFLRMAQLKDIVIVDSDWRQRCRINGKWECEVRVSSFYGGYNQTFYLNHVKSKWIMRPSQFTKFRSVAEARNAIDTAPTPPGIVECV